MTREILHSCCSDAVSSIKWTVSQKQAEAANAHLWPCFPHLQSCFLLEEWQPLAWSSFCSSAGLSSASPGHLWDPCNVLCLCDGCTAHWQLLILMLCVMSLLHVWSLSPYLFHDLPTHSDLQSLQILFVAYFSCLVCSVSSLHLVFGSRGMNRLWLNASFFRWHVSIVLKPFSAFYEFSALSKRSVYRHLALPIGHLQLYL